MVRPPGRHGDRRAAYLGLGAGFLLLVLAAMPQVLTGVLAAPMQADIGFSPEGLGIAIAVFWGSLTIAAPLIGHRVDQWGWAVSALIGAGFAAMSLVILGLLTTSYSWLLVGLAVGGVALAICSPASNIAIVYEVPRRFQGQAFGIKQSAMPAVALLAGLSVPLIAVTLGWRWVFLLSLAFVIPLLAIAIPHAVHSHRAATRSSRVGVDDLPVPLGENIVLAEQAEPVNLPEDPAHHHFAPYVPLTQLAVILGLGTMMLTSLSTFGMLTLVDSGIDLSISGLIIAAASGFALVSRIAAGWWIDRRERLSLRPIAAMIAVSVVGIVLLSTSQEHLAVLGMVIALTAGWGWPPIFILFTVRSHSHAPAGSTGVTAMGSGIGSIAGPLIFGTIAGALGFAVAWWFTAAVAVVTVIVVLLIQRGADQRTAPAMAELDTTTESTRLEGTTTPTEEGY